MKYGKVIWAASGFAALLMLAGCAYDPYYHPLAAHPARYQEEVVVVGHGPGPHRYYDHRYHGWGDHDWDDRY